MRRLLKVSISGWMPTHQYMKLVKPADLTRGSLYIYFLVPQKVTRVAVALYCKSYNATKDFTYNFRWEQFAGSKSYELFNCGRNKEEEISELSLSKISVLWELRLKDQMPEYLQTITQCIASQQLSADLQKTS